MKKTSGVVQTFSGKGLCIGIVASRFNFEITSQLLKGAEKILRQKGVKDIDVVWVPGAFEIPLMLQKLARKKKAGKKKDGLIALAAVIRGDTPHFDYVCYGTTQGIMKVSLQESIPVAFGMLTTNNVEQALERIGGQHGHKGEEAALTVIEMAHLIKGRIRESD